MPIKKWLSWIQHQLQRETSNRYIQMSFYQPKSSVVWIIVVIWCLLSKPEETFFQLEHCKNFSTFFMNHDTKFDNKTILSIPHFIHTNDSCAEITLMSRLSHCNIKLRPKCFNQFYECLLFKMSRAWGAKVQWKITNSADATVVIKYRNSQWR